MRTVRVPKKADGNRTEKEVNPPQRKEEKPMSQKKSGGLSE
jgi:hypothetical protein